MNILAGDIGGTNTRLLYATLNHNHWELIYEKQYPSQNYPCFDDVLNEFLSSFEIPLPVSAACLSVAGPVAHGSVAVTNLPWVINEKDLAVHLQSTHLMIINDFIAVANGIPELEDHDFITLHERGGDARPVNNDAVVIGAGTGLGAAHMVWCHDHYNVYSSEAGHAGFAPENSFQTELLTWMQKKYSHVSVELLLSGRGLFFIYQFLNQVKKLKQSEKVLAQLSTDDPARVIAEFALKNEDELCEKSIQAFIDIYGAVTGNIALHYYPVSTVYIAGGIGNKIKDKLVHSSFVKSFINKGKLADNMKSLNIKLITQENVGLYGALATCRRMYVQSCSDTA